MIGSSRRGHPDHAFGAAGFGVTQEQVAAAAGTSVILSKSAMVKGLRRFDGNITRAHLRMPTPYNTYTMTGLPPGPIASPGETALRAVAFPADVNYLYFVAKGDGTHTFSHTLKEHNKAVRKYQLGK